MVSAQLGVTVIAGMVVCPQPKLPVMNPFLGGCTLMKVSCTRCVEAIGNPQKPRFRTGARFWAISGIDNYGSGADLFVRGGSGRSEQRAGRAMSRLTDLWALAARQVLYPSRQK